jgi:hypothetical protein
MWKPLTLVTHGHFIAQYHSYGHFHTTSPFLKTILSITDSATCVHAYDIC